MLFKADYIRSPNTDCGNFHILMLYVYISGGTLKIYGETLRPDIPYKTLLLSTGDDVEYVIKEALEKYDLDKEDPSDFCLFQVCNCNRHACFYITNKSTLQALKSAQLF